MFVELENNRVVNINSVAYFYYNYDSQWGSVFLNDGNSISINEKEYELLRSHAASLAGE